MINLIIRPQVGIGNIQLGMTRERVHELLGDKYSMERRDDIVYDFYSDSYMQICYENNNVNFIELYNNCEFKVLLDNVEIFKTNADELILYLSKLDDFLNTNEAKTGYMFIYENLGVSLYRSRVCNKKIIEEQWFIQLSQEEKEDELKYLYFESVAIWSKGYYDSIKMYL